MIGPWQSKSFLAVISEEKWSWRYIFGQSFGRHQLSNRWANRTFFIHIWWFCDLGSQSIRDLVADNCQQYEMGINATACIETGAKHINKVELSCMVNDVAINVFVPRFTQLPWDENREVQLVHWTILQQEHCDFLLVDVQSWLRFLGPRTQNEIELLTQLLTGPNSGSQQPMQGYAGTV